MKPSCQTLSKAFEMSKKGPLTWAEGLQSKGLYILSVMERSCEMQRSPGEKLDWHSVNNFKELIEQGVKNDPFKHFAEGMKVNLIFFLDQLRPA